MHDDYSIVELRGGLANQLFQWATFREWSRRQKVRVKWDERFVQRPGMPGNRLLQLGLIDSADVIECSKLERLYWNTVARFGRRVLSYTVATTPLFNPRGYTVTSDLSRAGGQWFRGYFQDPRYFLSQRESIRHAFAAWETSTPLGMSDYAAIHVRRGDYVENPRNLARLGACSVEYFTNASKLIDNSLPIVIVSDDHEWCETVLGKNLNREYVIYAGDSDLDDFSVLKGAAEVVLSNSTFSWWAAFLGEPRRVVAPVPWFEVAEAGGEHLPLIATDKLSKVSGASLFH